MAGKVAKNQERVEGRRVGGRVVNNNKERIQGAEGREVMRRQKLIIHWVVLAARRQA